MHYKLIISSLILITAPTIVFAETDSYDKIATISNAVLNAFVWIGYAIALVMLITLGIKYLLSGANERAKVKEKVFPYIIGVALISLCVTIAGSVAKIVSKEDTEDPAGSFVDKTEELSGLEFEDSHIHDFKPVYNNEEGALPSYWECRCGEKQYTTGH